MAVEGIPTMLRSLVAPLVVLAALILSPASFPQNAAPQSRPSKDPATIPDTQPDEELDGWGRPFAALPKDHKSAAAPRRDISGTWDPPRLSGIGTVGAIAMPDDGKPEHQPPYTPLGLEMVKRTKPASGTRSAVPGDINDPVFIYGDPQGMPREDLYELRTIQIFQTPQNMAVLYQFNKVWRVIWTDGRELPKDPEPRWYGYSVGKWADDYTLVVETTGTDERTWIDRAGRPHGADLRVEERFHRPDQDHLELTVLIDDPKMYTKPWVALDKLRMERQPAGFDVREMIWSPSEYERYNKMMGNSAGEKGGH
jgi:hypothetical protein